MISKLLKAKYLLLFILILGIGLFFRTWNLGFGLPHSFYADEPEIAELAIKYTYEFKDIVSNNNYYKLIPISFVYGAFPSYLLTIKVMGISKLLNFFHIPFDKTTLYIVMRFIMVMFSLLIAFSSAILYKKIYKNTFGFFLTLLFLSLNWKFIVHSHYVNADIILAALINLSFLFLYLATKKNFDNKNTVLSAIFFGLAIGTKFTALISLPLFLFLLIFLAKKDCKATFGFFGTALATFMITNPFSIIFFKDFSFRIYEMFFKEAGMVFDSVDSNPFKYISATILMVGLPLLIFSIIGIIKSVKKAENKEDKVFHIFLIGNILIYILFYSLQSRRVDRWLLPILPILVIYASYGIYLLKRIVPRHLFWFLFMFLAAIYLYYPILLLYQFKRDTPKSAAYKWAKANIPVKETLLPYILVYTEEGLDPMNKLIGAKVEKINVYVSENAELFFPRDPSLYEYVILSSRPMSNYKRPEVRKAFPYYSQRWEEFEKKLQNKNNFELIKDFSLSKPNLIPLSDVFIYRNLKY
jgi:hypothetical protein